MGLVLLRISGRDGVVANPRRSEILSAEFALDQESWQGTYERISFLKFPEKSFSTPTGNFTHAPVKCNCDISTVIISSLFDGLSDLVTLLHVLSVAKRVPGIAARDSRH
jgi:hypothetical protein